jgi:hypothetical protein
MEQISDAWRGQDLHTAADPWGRREDARHNSRCSARPRCITTSQMISRGAASGTRIGSQDPSQDLGSGSFLYAKIEDRGVFLCGLPPRVTHSAVTRRAFRSPLRTRNEKLPHPATHRGLIRREQRTDTSVPRPTLSHLEACDACRLRGLVDRPRDSRESIRPRTSRSSTPTRFRACRRGPMSP